MIYVCRVWISSSVSHAPPLSKGAMTGDKQTKRGNYARNNETAKGR